MKSIFSFLRGGAVLLKKDVKLYGSKIASTLLLLLLLAAGTVTALAAILQSDTSDSDTILHMAIYDREPSKLTTAAITAVSGTEVMRELMDVDICTSEDEVRAGIKSGKYDAALIFEEGYYTKILDGNDSAVCILLSSSLESAADMVKHFALTGEKLIETAEAGVEGLYAPLAEKIEKAEARKAINAMELNFALKLFSIPTDGFTIETVPYSSAGLGEAEYYIICFAAFLMLICEVVFFPYTARDCEFSMLRRIKSYRVSNVAMTVEKAVIPFFIRALLLLGTAALAGRFTDVKLTAGAVLCALCSVLLISIFMAALSVLLSQSTLGISVIFALSAASLVLCGGIIPQSMLPYEVSVIGAHTPMGACIDMLSPLLGGDCTIKSVIYLSAVTVTSVAAASLYMRRICKGGGER